MSHVTLGVALAAQPSPSPSGAGHAVTWVDVAPIVIAALALIVSVVVGVWNRGTSKKALALAERQEARLQSRVDVYVDDSVARRSNKDRCVGVNVVVKNRADVPTSIVQAELRLTYEVRGTMTTVRVRASDACGFSAGSAAVVSLGLPVRLDANDAVYGWFGFLLQKSLTDGRPIARYDLVVRDVHGQEEAVQLGIFREEPGGEATQDQG